MSFDFILLGVLANWVTPLWLLGVGVTLGLAILALKYGILRLALPRLADSLLSTVTEGVLLPIMYLAVVLAGFSVVALAVVPFRGLLASVTRIPSVGGADREYTIPKASKEVAIPLEFRPNELQAFELTSDQPLTVYTKVTRGAGYNGAMRVAPRQPQTWNRASQTEQIFSGNVSEWTVDNIGATDARLLVHTDTDIEYPEVRIIPGAALAFLALVGLFWALRLFSPKVAAIALTTAKESMGQPLFSVALAIGLFLLLILIIIPYNTFGEDLKMLKDCGLTLIMVLAILVAVWSASVSVADEIEGRTALTVLSKPIRRWQFILGKFLGVISPVVLMFVMLGFFFLITISYKMTYDARETAHPDPTWQVTYYEVIRTVPGLALALMETVVLASISVALSTRLPMLANLIVCSAIYVLGHLVPMLVNSSVGKFEIVRFVGQLIATVLPVLDHFNIQAAVAAGADVPHEYLAWALAYCVLYSGIAMLLALVMFEDRDLA